MSTITFLPISSAFREIIPVEWVSNLNAVFGPLRIAVISERQTSSTEEPDNLGDLNWDETGFYIKERFAILIEGGIVLDLPFFNGARLRIGNIATGGMPMFLVETKISQESFFKIRELPITLHLPRNIIRTYELNEEDVWEEVTEGLDNIEGEEQGGYDLIWEPSLIINGDGFEFSGELGEVKPFMIGDTGVIIDLRETDIQLITNEVPSDLIETLPEDFKGIYISTASVIYFKPGARFDPKITVREVGIGSGGFTGEIYFGNAPESDDEPANFSSGILNGLFEGDTPHYENEEEREGRRRTDEGGNTRNIYPVQVQSMKAVLDYFGIGFRQSIPEWGTLQGYINMPFIDQWVRLRATIGGPNGDFMLEIGGVGNEGLINLENDIFKITADSIAYELRKVNGEDVNYAVISGRIKLKQPADLNCPELRANRIAIGSNGDIQIEGGWVRAPQQITLDLKGFKIGLREFGLGTDNPNQPAAGGTTTPAPTGDTPPAEGGTSPQPIRQWVGFSGEVQLVEGLPIKGSVEGLKISWVRDHPSPFDTLKVTLRGIGVEFKIPGTLEFSGSVEYVESPTFDGFKGQVSVKLIALRTEVAGTLMVGKGRDAQGREFGVFYIQLQATLPTALPLGATGTGLFGIRGLVGINVAPTKTDEQSWYDWYKATPEYNVVDIRKWQPLYDNYAFGAGIQLGTIYDDGTTLNLGAMLVVLIPGPVIMLEGKANLLKVRAAGEGSEREEGAFYLLAVLDGRAGTFQLNIDVRYSLQDVVRVTGGLEAFFDFNNDQNWYLYIGRKEPDSKRIQAEVLALFRANVYFMISPQSLQLGAFVGLSIRETFGPVSFALVARISFDLTIFFKPFQLEGRLELMAEIALTVFGIGFRLMLQMILEGKTPNPFLVYGKGKLVLTLPFPLPSVDLEVELRWTGPNDPKPVNRLLKGVSFIHHKAKDWNRTLDVVVPEVVAAPEADATPEADAAPEADTATETVAAIVPDWSNKEDDSLPRKQGEIDIPTVVSVDSTLVLTFAKRIHNLKRADNEYASLIDEQADLVSGKTFAYQLEELVLEKYTGAEENPWSLVKAAVNQPDTEGKIPATTFKILRGDEGQSSSSFLNGIAAEEPIIQLWQYKPYEFTNTFQRDNINDLYPPCEARRELTTRTIHWKDEPRGKTFNHIFVQQGVVFLADKFMAVEGGSKGSTWSTVAMPKPFVGDPMHTSLFYEVEKGVEEIRYTHFDGRYKCLRTSNCKIIFPGHLYKVVVYIIPGFGDENLNKEAVPPFITAFKGEDPRGIGEGVFLPLDGVRVLWDENESFVRELPILVVKYEITSEQGFDNIRIEETVSRDRGFWLQRIEYVTLEEYQQNRPVSSSEAAEPLHPVAEDLVLEPDSIYRLKIVTNVSDGGSTKYYGEKGHTDYFFFKTDLGPGIPENNAAASPVEKVETYVARTLPKHGALAHYYGYDINIVFNENYFEKLYGDKPLYLRLCDRNGKIAGEAQIGNFKEKGLFAILQEHLPLITWLRGLSEGKSSTEACQQKPIPPVWQPVANFPAVSGLQPNSMYVASLLVVAENGERLIYEFQFSTSRYQNFQQHFNQHPGQPYVSRVVSPVAVRLEELETITPPAAEAGVETHLYNFRNLMAATGPSLTYQTTRIDWRNFVLQSAQEETMPMLSTDVSHLAGLRLLRTLAESGEHTASAIRQTFDEIYKRIEGAFVFNRPDGTVIDMRNRDLPANLEYIQIPLADENMNLLLLESPEPVEWNRISGTVNGEAIGFLPNVDATRAFLIRGLTLGFDIGTYDLSLEYSGESDGKTVQTQTKVTSGAEGVNTRPVLEVVTLQLVLSVPQPQQPQQTPALQVFRHVTDSPNIEANRTILTYPALQDNPRALIFPARVWGNERFGTSNRNTIGVQYAGRNWAIVNQNPASAATINDSFNVLIAPAGHPNAFIHTATAENTLENRTYLDHQLTNLRPNVYLLVVQRGAVLNNHELAVRFDLDRGRWYIFNKIPHAEAQAEAAYRMPLHAQFNILVVQGSELADLTAFSHQVKAENFIPPGTTILDNLALNGRSGAMVFFTECWREDFRTSPDMVAGAHSVGVGELWYDHPDDVYKQYRDNHWAIFNTVGGMSIDQGFNLFVWVPQPNLHFLGFKHTVNEANSQNWTTPYTALDHMRLSNNPNAMVFVMPDWGVGANNQNHFRVDYNLGQWRIYNQQASALMNASYVFNVLIAPDNCPNTFIHRANAGNLSMNRTYIDHPLCNNQENAYLMVTQRGNVINDRAIIVAYEAGNGRWFIANQINQGTDDPYDSTRHGIPSGAEFNVLVINGTSYTNIQTFSHVAAEDTIIPPGQNITFIDQELLNRNPRALFYAMPCWRPDRAGASYNNSPTAVWFDSPADAWDYKEGYWSVYNCTPGMPMTPTIAFNIFVLT